MKKRTFLKPRWLSAQSATELAIFGAIVMFVIGGLIKVGLSMSQRTNTQLRAFRLALLESYRTSEGAYGDIVAARNSSSIMILEDRLSVDAGSKQGTSSRVPFLAQGSGTFSKNMLYPKDLGEKSNYPFYDVFINGQRFPFIMADFINISFRVNAGQPQIVRSRNTRLLNIINLPYCDTVTHPQPCWSRGGGFAVLFRKNYNYPANEDWCSTGCTKNLEAKWRFDLDLDGDLADNGDGYVPDNDLYGGATPTKLRAKFLWQWVVVAVHTPEAVPLLSVTFGSGAGAVTIPAGGLFPADEGGRIDVDLDFQDETIHTMTVGVSASGTGAPIVTLKVMDTQEGEMNFSWDGRDDAFLAARRAQWETDCNPIPPAVPLPGCSAFPPTQPEVGLAKDVRMYSYTKDGTYLRIEEGKLLNPLTKQVIRSTTKRDHVDIIERVFYLSNDTDRFCDANGQRVVWGTTLYAYAEGVYGIGNPVEACNNCFVQGNVRNTCFDETTKILYIRSRLDDRRGHKWQTILK